MAKPKWRYEAEFKIGKAYVDPDNERQTIRKSSFMGLRHSIKRKGVLTPIGISVKCRTYKVLFGNTRYLSSKSLGNETIPAKLYYNLTPEQESEIQVIENSTKTTIIISTLLSLAIFFIFESIKGIILFAAAIIPVLLFINYIKKRINGMTGDTIGATNEIAEVLILLLCFFK